MVGCFGRGWKAETDLLGPEHGPPWQGTSRLERQSGVWSAGADAIGESLRQPREGSDEANDGVESCDPPAPPRPPSDTDLSISKQFGGKHRPPRRRWSPGRLPGSVGSAAFAGRARSGILVKLRLGSFVETVALDTSSLTDSRPDGQLPLGKRVEKRELVIELIRCCSRCAL